MHVPIHADAHGGKKKATNTLELDLQSDEFCIHRFGMLSMELGTSVRAVKAFNL